MTPYLRMDNLNDLNIESLFCGGIIYVYNTEYQ